MSSTVAVKAFAEGVTQQIKDYLPEDYQDMECEILEQQKNNGVVLTGMILNMPGQKIAPVVYMEPFYDQVRKGGADGSDHESDCRCVQTVFVCA